MVVGEVSAEEQGYLDKVKQQPLTFYVSIEANEVAWGRAGDWFIRGHSSMRLRRATIDEFDTDDPLQSLDYGYKVTRMRVGDRFQYSVRCVEGSDGGIYESWYNARLLAHYIETGRLFPRFIDK